MKDSMNMLGIVMDCMSYNDMHKVFDEWLSSDCKRAHVLALVNVNCCVSALFNSELRKIYNSADIVGIDSMPFLQWARMFHKGDSDRLYAPDILLEVSARAVEKKYSFFFLGGYPGAPERMEADLREKFGDINVVGKVSPPFREMTSEEDQELCALINRAKPDFLWVGLGSPKQDIWINEHKGSLEGCIIVPSGATFDFFSGRVRQAPKWIRDAGFEWLFRLTQDFRRLWVRYTFYNVVFVCAFGMQLLGILKFPAERGVSTN